MLAQIPSHRPRASLVSNCLFGVLAVAVFAVPMLNIVPVQALLAQAEEKSLPSQSEQAPEKPLPRIANAPPVNVEAVPEEKSEPSSKGLAGIGGTLPGISVEEAEVVVHSPAKKQVEYLPEPTEREKEILSKLNSPIDFPFNVQQETLQGVIDLLKIRLEIQILYDRKALDDEGIALDTPQFDLDVSDVKVESLLKLLLEPNGLDYCVENGVLKITTHQALEARKGLYIYPIADLVQSREDLAEILDAVENTLRVRGMEGVYSINAATRSLIATHSYVSHQEVLNLLRSLRQVASTINRGPLPTTGLPGLGAPSGPTTRTIESSTRRGGGGGTGGGFGGSGKVEGGRSGGFGGRRRRDEDDNLPTDDDGGRGAQVSKKGFSGIVRDSEVEKSDPKPTKPVESEATPAETKN